MLTSILPNIQADLQTCSQRWKISPWCNRNWSFIPSLVPASLPSQHQPQWAIRACIALYRRRHLHNSKSSNACWPRHHGDCTTAIHSSLGLQWDTVWALFSCMHPPFPPRSLPSSIQGLHTSDWDCWQHGTHAQPTCSRPPHSTHMVGLTSGKKAFHPQPGTSLQPRDLQKAYGDLQQPICSKEALQLQGWEKYLHRPEDIWQQKSPQHHYWWGHSAATILDQVSPTWQLFPKMTNISWRRWKKKTWRKQLKENHMWNSTMRGQQAWSPY